jgi:hypothetical protein
MNATQLTLAEVRTWLQSVPYLRFGQRGRGLRVDLRCAAQTAAEYISLIIVAVFDTPVHRLLDDDWAKGDPGQHLAGPLTAFPLHGNRPPCGKRGRRPRWLGRRLRSGAGSRPWMNSARWSAAAPTFGGTGGLGSAGQEAHGQVHVTDGDGFEREAADG